MRMYRMQDEGIEFDDMVNFNSTNWGTGEQLSGLCAYLYSDDLKYMARICYHGDYAGQEVVIFEGAIIEDVGDGVTADPSSEIARLPLSEFMSTEFDD